MRPARSQLHGRWQHVEQELGASELPRTCLYHERYPTADVELADGDRPALVRAEDEHLVACFELRGEETRRP